MVGEVSVGIVGHATMTAVIDLTIVNKLLLGERDQATAEDGIGTLNSLHRGEGPAGTARALVLDWSRHASFNPVDRGRRVSFGVDNFT